MVPPIYVTDNTSLVRVGDQQTYVFYKDGIETFVIRPGFSGKVEDFGMLISFPTPPALRKVLGGHLPADRQGDRSAGGRRSTCGWRSAQRSSGSVAAAADSRAAGPSGLKLQEGRSPRAQAKRPSACTRSPCSKPAAPRPSSGGWTTTATSIPTAWTPSAKSTSKLGWCFVAEKAKVGGKANVDPKPRMKGVDTKLPAGSAFDGHVQAMAFRFKTDKLVLPMRLSAYNEGDLHNIVYLLTDGPRKIRSIPEEYVVRQLTGEDLFRNVTAAAAAADHRRHRGRHPGLAAAEPAAAARPGAAQRLRQGAVRLATCWR